MGTGWIGVDADGIKWDGVLYAKKFVGDGSGLTNVGTSISEASGAILYSNSSGEIDGDTSNLYWDDTKNFMGIGTTSPGTTLDVNGITTLRDQLKFVSGSTTYGFLTFGSGPTLAIQGGSDGTGTVYINSAGGNVGIGTTTPATPLQVAGAIISTSSSMANLTWTNWASGANIDLTGYITLNGASGTSGAVLTTQGTADPIWTTTSSGISEQTEESSTPVTDDQSVALGTATTFFAPVITIPTTYKFYKITALEWKNGAVVAGNTKASCWIVDAQPPVSANILKVAQTDVTANSGTNSVQKVNVTDGGFVVNGGTKVAGAVIASNATQEYRTQNVGSVNNNKAIVIGTAYTPYDATAWGASTQGLYLKIYYKGYN